jgi:RND family efflux transporter MFP subunit
LRTERASDAFDACDKRAFSVDAMPALPASPTARQRPTRLRAHPGGCLVTFYSLDRWRPRIVLVRRHPLEIRLLPKGEITVPCLPADSNTPLLISEAQPAIDGGCVAIQRFAACVVIAIAFTVGCNRLAKLPPATAPTLVTVSQPIEREVTDFADFTGRTAAVDSVEVRARVNGYLEKVNFKEGALVHKGDVLFEIDPRPYQAQVDIATGQVAAADAMVQRTQADDARAKALRATNPGAISQQDLDQYQAAADQATANADTARATLKKDQLDLDFTKVESPIDGRVSRYYVTRGNLVMQDQTLLTTIVSVDPIYAYFDVDESTVLHVRELIRTGKMQSAREVSVPAWLSVTSDDGFPYEGTINFIDNQVDPKTGTLRARGVFPNKDETLSPGFFVRVRVRIGVPHEAILVSERAVLADQGQKIVYVVNDKDEVVYRPIRVGARHGSLIEVEEGLKVDERIIVNGLQRVRPGATVEPKLVDMPGAAESAAAATTANAAPGGAAVSKQQ